MNNKGKVFVISGPSGVGKDTVISEVLKKHKNLMFSVSTISRDMRPGETEGEKYHFISKSEFVKIIEEDGFLEYAEYCGNYYGTPKKPIEEWTSEGKNVLVEIEVQGAKKLMSKLTDAVFIFIMPPSLSVLKNRLIGRKTDNTETINKRIIAATLEIKSAIYYNYIVYNMENKLFDCVDDICDIIDGKMSPDKTEKKEKNIEEVLKNA